MRNQEMRMVLFLCLILEGSSIILLPSKLPSYIGFLLLLSGIIGLLRLEYSIDSQKLFLKIPIDFFPFTGLLIITLGLIANFFVFSPHIGQFDYIIFMCGLCWILYKYIPDEFGNERDYTFLFLNLVSILFIILGLFVKYASDIEGFLGWDNNEILVNSLLARPLANFLTILGYEIVVDRDTIIYFDTTIGTTQRVWIAAECSGIYSVLVFLAGFTAFLFTSEKGLSFNSFLLMILGIITAYLANIIRMATVILAGHYWGGDALLWTHYNAGWVIFTFWVFVFWWILFKLDSLSELPELKDTSTKELKKEYMRNQYSKYWLTAREEKYVSLEYDNQHCNYLYKKLSSQARILDVGVGDGNPYAAYFQNKDMVVHGIDISPLLVEKCNKLNPKIIVKVGDSEDIRYDTDYFDMVYCFHTSWYFPNLIRSIEEMVRVCKRGKYIYLDIQNSLNPKINSNFQREIFENKGIGKVIKFTKNVIRYLIGRKTINWSYIITEVPADPNLIYSLESNNSIEEIQAYVFENGKLKKADKVAELESYPKITFRIQKSL